MDDNKLKSLESLERVKAPANFVEQVRSRLEKKSLWQRIFLPLQIKIPLQLAGTLVTVLLVTFIYNAYQPEQLMVSKERLKSEKTAKLSAPKATASGAGAKSKIYQEPIELALVMAAPAAPEKSMMRESAASGMSLNLELADEKTAVSQADPLQTIILSVQGKVISKINNQYIIEVPQNRYKVLVNELEQLGKITSKTPPTITDQETLLIYLTVKK